MPKLSYRQPRYCRHRDRAVVYVNGKAISLGKFGTPESKAAYKRLMAKWNAGHVAPIVDSELPPDEAPLMLDVPVLLTVVELIKRYCEFSATYYVKDGIHTSEVYCIKSAAAFLRRKFGRLPAAEFSPLKLEVVRDAMIRAKLSRGTINKNANRLRRMFKWAASKEMIPGSVFADLRTVEGLKSGRSNARESEPITPVDDAVVKATLPNLSPIVADMIRVQELIYL